MRCKCFQGAALLACLMIAHGQAKVPPSAGDRDPYPQQPGPLKVFILAGQSNMQGHASLRNLEYLLYNEETAADYEHLKDKKGDWVLRNDVWVSTNDGNRVGSLKPGFGANEWKFGPELGFGWTVGEKLEQQVLLIKTCWGGKNVKCDFLSPGSPMPTAEQLAQDLARLRKKKPDTTMDDVKSRYGQNYRDMLAIVRDVLGNLQQRYPNYDEQQGYELAGFVWFQGWNDMVDRSQKDDKFQAYTERLGQLIRDVRKDLDCPELPVIIGELGVGGEPGDFQAAQRAVADLPGLKNVAFVETHQFWDPAVEQLVKDGVWKGPEWPKFYNVGSERGYHYLGSGKIMYQMGAAFGAGMLPLLGN